MPESTFGISISFNVEPSLAQRSIPCDSTPLILTGFRLTTTKTFLPINSVGLYFSAIPETICLISVPILTKETNNLSDFSTFLQSIISPTLRSIF